MIKKVIVFVMVLGVFLSFSVMAQVAPESDFQVELTKDGTGCVIMEYIGKSRNVIIPNTIQGFPVKRIHKWSNEWPRDIFYTGFVEIIVMPDSVEKIDDYVFQFEQKLSNITLSKCLEKIPNYAFQNCESLKSIEIPSAIKRIARGAFQGCSSLQSVKFSDSLEEIGNVAFWGCKNLVSIDFPDSLKKLAEQHSQRRQIFSKVKFPNNSIEIVDYAFNKSGIVELIVTGNMIFVVEDYPYCHWFDNCNKLTNVIIEGDIMSLPEDFLSSTSLKTITFKSLDTTIRESTFSSCPNLTLAAQAEIRKHIK